MTPEIASKVIAFAIEAAKEQVALARDGVYLGVTVNDVIAVDGEMGYGIGQSLAYEITGTHSYDLLPKGALDLCSITYSAAVKHMATLVNVPVA